MMHHRPPPRAHHACSDHRPQERNNDTRTARGPDTEMACGNSPREWLPGRVYYGRKIPPIPVYICQEINPMSMADELEKLNRLKENGILSEQEYQRSKESLLAQNMTTGEKSRQTVGNISIDTNQWGMFIHLSQFLGYFVPVAGWVVPIVLWQIRKQESPCIDQHGCNVTNWIISELIYYIVSLVLCLVLIGWLLLIPLLVVSIVFPIIGAVKANNGDVWEYPLTIRFLRCSPMK